MSLINNCFSTNISSHNSRKEINAEKILQHKTDKYINLYVKNIFIGIGNFFINLTNYFFQTDYEGFFYYTFKKHTVVNQSNDASNFLVANSEIPLNYSNIRQVNRVIERANERLDSFFDYRERQNVAGLPVDLIVGRGRRKNEEYLPLCTHRSIEINNKRCLKEYSPYTIDCSQDDPDYIADICSINDMSHFPDESVDDIYLECLYPATNVIVNLAMYYNAARILKVGGTLIIDLNEFCVGGQEPAVREHLIKILRELLPFVQSAGKHERNSMSDTHRICLCKYAPLDHTWDSFNTRKNMESESKKIFFENSMRTLYNDLKNANNEYWRKKMTR